MKWKYLLTRIPGVPIAIANGSIRQFIYQVYFDELPAHQLSVLSFIPLFGLYVWFIIPWLKLNSTVEAIHVGVFWLAITVIFEFIFGHFVMGHPWTKLFHDYNFLEGRIWVVVLIWITISPLVLRKLKNYKNPPTEKLNN